MARQVRENLKENIASLFVCPPIREREIMSVILINYANVSFY